MTAVLWWMAGLTVLVVAAVVLAVVVLVRSGSYLRQARGVIAAYAPLVERQADTAERLLPLLQDRSGEPTERLEPVEPTAPASRVEDPDLYGRHALTTPTAFVAAEGEFRIPPYYFAAAKGEAR